MAPGLGLEPRLKDPESLVLPLHHPGMGKKQKLFQLVSLKQYKRKIGVCQEKSVKNYLLVRFIRKVTDR